MKVKKQGFKSSMFLIFLLICIFTLSGFSDENVTSPQKYFGFKMGSDQKLARWDKIVEYFSLLERESNKIKVLNMGPSTMGNPFLVLIISSADNLKNLNTLQKINKQISNPKNITQTELQKLIEQGKAVVCQSMGLHASEVGGTQMTPELAYDLLNRTDEETKRILDNVLFFMIPCFNPDGEIMIVDWYKTYVNTKYEGISLPWLYHKYLGHDTNRDGDFLSMVESQYAAKIMYRDWPPQAYIDHHQMGSYGARFYVPPYCEPIRPFADPLIWREISWYGSHIAYKLEENGIKGVLNAAMFPGWGHFGWHWITPFHNIAGMLTESASVKLASPVYIHPEQLKGGSRAFPEYKPQSTFPSPWQGGWWRLEDIVEQKKISAWALLDLAARNKETVLKNAYLKARNQTIRGTKGKYNAIIIPHKQHDGITGKKMINTLLKSGIEIQKSSSDFKVNGRIYQKGSYLISLAQPKMGLIRNLLMKTRYADNDWTRDKHDTPLRPYDLSTHTMNEFMGVNAVPVKINPKKQFKRIDRPEIFKGSVKDSGKYYLLDGRLNNSYIAVNKLLKKGAVVQRIKEKTSIHQPGDFVVTGDSKLNLKSVADSTGIKFKGINKIPTSSKRLRKARVGVFKRYWGGNIDEGWTRFLLEQFEFPYKSLMDAEIKAGKLKKQYDTIVIPADSPGMITGIIPERYKRWISTEIPIKYKSGFKQAGVKKIIQFVKDGGTLVCIGESCEFAINEFKLKVRNVLKGLKYPEFFCSGSTLQARFNNSDELAYGMPSEGLVLYRSSPAFEIIPGRHNEDYKTIVRYPERDILQSGWLIGEKQLAKKAAMVEAKYGKGRVVLIGIRAQHRYQTHGTFKLLFNTLYK